MAPRPPPRRLLLFGLVVICAALSLAMMWRLGGEAWAVSKNSGLPVTAGVFAEPRPAASLRQSHRPSSAPRPTSGRARTPPTSKTSNTSAASKKRKPGRDGVDHSHVGMIADPTDGMLHAWAAHHSDAHECFGSRAVARCADAESAAWFREHVLLSIITGSEGAFRVEVSQCTWLSHFPVENVFVLSDVVPLEGHNRTPHTWVRGELPHGVREEHGDIFSSFIKDGYTRVVRKRGQGYSASWIVAQFRFAQAVEHMRRVDADRLQRRGGKSYQWFMIADDDTIVQLPNLVKRLKQLDAQQNFYLSRKGWGGAGHIYSRAAFDKLVATLPQCVDKYFVRSFRASDDMLLKCAHMAHLHCQMEDTMSHCPASHLGAGALLSDRQVTFHGKKDYYPPVVLTSWRVGLYYYASYCKDKEAARLATFYSACAFGSCKQSGCTKEKNEAMLKQWWNVSKNNSLTVLPFAAEGVLVNELRLGGS